MKLKPYKVWTKAEIVDHLHQWHDVDLRMDFSGYSTDELVEWHDKSRHRAGRTDIVPHTH